MIDAIFAAFLLLGALLAAGFLGQAWDEYQDRKTGRQA